MCWISHGIIILSTFLQLFPVSGAETLPVKWNNPGIISAGVLPSNPAGYISNPPLPPRLVLNSATGDFISLGQLQLSDSQVYDFTAPGVFEGTFSFGVQVSSKWSHNTYTASTIRSTTSQNETLL